MPTYVPTNDEDLEPRTTGAIIAPEVSSPLVTAERLAAAKEAVRALAIPAVAPVPGFGGPAAYALLPEQIKQQIASKLKGNWDKPADASSAPSGESVTDGQRRALAINPFDDSDAPTRGPVSSYPSPRVTPGGMQLTSRVTQPGVRFTPNVGEQLNAAEYDANESKRLGSEAAVERASIDAKSADTQLNAYVAAQKAEEARQARMKTSYDAQMRKADEMQQRASEMHEDPDGYWKERGAGARLLAIIGQAAGAYGAAITHTPNFAAQMIEGEVQRHIRAQEANTAKAERSAKSAADRAGSLRAEDLDDHQSYLAKQNEGLTVARLDVARQMANVNSKEAGARLAAVDAELREKIASNRAGIEAQTADRVQNHETYRAPQMIGGGVGGAAQVDPKLLVRAPDGSTLVARSAEEASKIREEGSAAASLQDNFQEAIRLRKERIDAAKSGNLVRAYKIDRELDTLAEDTLPQISLAMRQGQVKEEEAKRYKKTLTRFSSLGPGADEDIEAQRQRLQSHFQRRLEGQASPLASVGYVQNQAGQVVPGAGYAGQDYQGAPKIDFQAGLGPRAAPEATTNVGADSAADANDGLVPVKGAAGAAAGRGRAKKDQEALIRFAGKR